VSLLARAAVTVSRYGDGSHSFLMADIAFGDQPEHVFVGQ